MAELHPGEKRSTTWGKILLFSARVTSTALGGAVVTWGCEPCGGYGMSCSGVCTISVKVRALHERLTRQSAGTEMTITLFLLIVNISIEKVGLKRNHSGVVGAVVAALW